MEPKELIEKRKQLGYTQVEMAKCLCTPYATYANWERGRRRIPGIVGVAVLCVEFLRKEV
jgi:DNA-binding transcriptional regulator YiaG